MRVQINDHIHAGMMGLYTLEGPPITPSDQGNPLLQEFDTVNYFSCICISSLQLKVPILTNLQETAICYFCKHVTICYYPLVWLAVVTNKQQLCD